MDNDNYLHEVRVQYENYPYPPRDPQNETQTLISTYDQLSVLNHYCYKGCRQFNTNFRVLIAGGGTGDSLIYLAEQLRDTSAEIYYLDMSLASMSVAKARAKVRCLTNITWIHDSLLNIPQLDLDKFDYINCMGVLHHLDNPSEGLGILAGALADDGAIGIMVYGKLGRTAVYQMQALMRLVNNNEADLQHQVDNTKAILADLPEENYWLQQLNAHTGDHKRYGDVGIFDLFLHSQDRAYTVTELYQWLSTCDLNLIEFIKDKLAYVPEAYIKNSTLLKDVLSRPVSEKQAIAEALSGTLAVHTFCCSKQPRQAIVANPSDKDMVPFFYGFNGSHLDICKKLTVAEVIVFNVQNTKVQIQKQSATTLLFKYMDGQTTITEIIDKVVNEFGEVDRHQAFAQFISFYQPLNTAGLLLLRHKSVPPYKSVEELQQLTKAL